MLSGTPMETTLLVIGVARRVGQSAHYPKTHRLAPFHRHSLVTNCILYSLQPDFAKIPIGLSRLPRITVYIGNPFGCREPPI